MGAYSRWALANKYGILQNAQQPTEEEWTLERLEFRTEWVKFDKFHYKGKTKLEHVSFLFPCRSVKFRIIFWILTYQYIKLNCCRRMTTRSFLDKIFTHPCDTDIQINDIRVLQNKNTLMKEIKSSSFILWRETEKVKNPPDSLHFKFFTRRAKEVCRYSFAFQWLPFFPLS